jgi:FkbM family methyltransferase
MIEPTLFPEALYVKQEFWKRYFGDNFYNDSSVCAFGFEPNPVHTSRLQRLGMFYRSFGRRVEFFKLAVSDAPGAVTMYDHRGDAAKSHWRFGRFRKSYHPVNVDAIDLGIFIQDELIGRIIPTSRSVAFSAEKPAILMKLDIEGDELKVLERLLRLDLLCKIDLITWEFHDYLLPTVEKQFAAHARLWRFIIMHQREEDEDKFSRPRHISIRREYKVHEFMRDMQSYDTCKTRFVARDDEGYLMTPDVLLGRWSPKETYR